MSRKWRKDSVVWRPSSTLHKTSTNTTRKIATFIEAQLRVVEDNPTDDITQHFKPVTHEIGWWNRMSTVFNCYG
eukprot:12939173-Prorocentrum_lima.AAC.1